MAETNTSGNVANVTVGKGKVGGYFFSAPLNTELPTSSSAALSSDYIKIGYVSEDGLTNTFDDSVETENVKDWSGKVIKTIETSYSSTEKFSLTVIESNEQVFKQIFGDANVTTSTGTITVDNKAEQRPDRVYVFETMLDNKAQRIIVPRGQIVSVSDVKYQPGAIVSFTLEIEAKLHDTLGICSRRIIG